MPLWRGAAGMLCSSRALPPSFTRSCPHRASFLLSCATAPRHFGCGEGRACPWAFSLTSNRYREEMLKHNRNLNPDMDLATLTNGPNKSLHRAPQEGKEYSPSSQPPRPASYSVALRHHPSKRQNNADSTARRPARHRAALQLPASGRPGSRSAR